MIELQRIEILHRAAAHPSDAPLPDGMRLVELTRNELDRACMPAPGLIAPRDRQRCLARFRHRLRCFVLEAETGDAVAWTWLAAGVPRYLDELCWLVALQPDQAWVRDCEVLPARRGQRLLARLIEAIAQHLGRSTEFLVDIDASNRASLRAHQAAGFSPIARVYGARLPGHRVLRQRPPPHLPPVTALRPQQRMIRLDADEQAWHQNHLA